MEIYVYKGEWGLPTIDFDCCRILTYIKLTKAPVKIQTKSNPFTSPNGLLPYLKVDNRKIASYAKIVEYLSSQGFRCNKHEEFILINGHIENIIENLHPFFLYEQWGDPKNIDFTRGLYAYRTPFPFNFYCPRKYISKTNELMETLANFSIEDPAEQHDTASMMLNAKKCINWIAEKIGDNDWFLGQESSEIDATIFGYLSIILHATLPNNLLQIHLRQCTNLVKYVERITKKYFAEDGFCTANAKNSHRKTEEETSTFYTGKEDDENVSAKRKRILLSGFVALITMTAYAIYSGILHISREEIPSNMFQYDEDLSDDE
uniref:Putative translocase of outer mitochondrial membrane complex subunit tom37/metaxin 1 n=1 Tax=Corethrella appendiculata TaxID=1370023 RepID=U5ETA2_9DIPT